MRQIISFNNKNVILPEPWVQPGPPNDELWYTSTDGNIVTPYEASALPTIVSNTYVDGKGVIKFATEVTSIGARAFERRASLTSMTFPNSVTSIGEYAFLYCTSLTSVTIPNGVTSIGYAAFGNCHSFTSIDIPNSVTSIGDAAFQKCTSLTSVTIPNSVKSIGISTFSYTGLTSVIIGNGLTYIGQRAFEHSNSLTTISYTGTMSQWNSINKCIDWNWDVPATVVHCTDGDAPI